MLNLKYTERFLLSANYSINQNTVRFFSYGTRLRNKESSAIVSKSSDEKKAIEPIHSPEYNDFLNDNLKIVALPINDSQFYLQYLQDNQLIHFEHKVISIEKKVSTKALSYWQKLKDSKKSYATYTVKTIEKLLEKLPWSEQSFASIPSEQFIIKRLQATELAQKAFPNKRYITFFDYINLVKTSPELTPKLEENPIIKPMKIYIPKIPGNTESKAVIGDKIYQMASMQAKYYSKQMWKCIAAFPLTFPLILIPLVPNIPGFYICYRLYWNFKAFAGAKHIMEMYHKNQGSSFQLEYVPEFTKSFNKIYDTEEQRLLLKNDEQMDAFETLVKDMDLDKAKANVLRAVMQENYK